MGCSTRGRFFRSLHTRPSVLVGRASPVTGASVVLTKTGPGAVSAWGFGEATSSTTSEVARGNAWPQLASGSAISGADLQSYVKKTGNLVKYGIRDTVKGGRQTNPVQTVWMDSSHAVRDLRGLQVAKSSRIQARSSDFLRAVAVKQQGVYASYPPNARRRVCGQ